MKNRLPLLLIAFLFTCLTASAQSWIWGTEGQISQISGSLHYTAEGWSVAADKKADSYLTGGFLDDTLIVGSDTLISPYSSYTYYNWNAYIIKYDSNSNVLWAVQAQNCSNYASSFANSTTTDDFGNVYITGYFADTVAFGSDTLRSNVHNSVFLVKYNAQGNELWAKQSTNSSSLCEGYGNSVTTDISGNIYITGDYTDTINMGTISLEAINGNGVFYAKYDSSGNLLWAKQPVATSLINQNMSESIFADKFNNVFITGAFGGTLTFGSTSLSSIINAEVFLAKLDSSGNTLWAKQSTSTNKNINGYIGGFGVTADKSGNSYVTGTFYDTVSFDSYNLETKQSQNIFLVKYDPKGNVIWGKASNVIKGGSINLSPGWSWTGYNLAVDTANNIYLSCGGGAYTARQNCEVVFGTDTVNIAGNTLDAEGSSIVVKFDSSGDVLCAVGIDGGGDDANGIAVDPSGKYVFFGGDLYNGVRFGPDSLPFENAETPFMARWQPCSGCDLAVTLSPSQSLCSGQSITLIASGTTNYSWSPSTGLSATTGSSVVATPTSTVTYTVTSGSGSCMSTDTIVLTVIPSPNTPTFTQNGDTLISSSVHDNQWYRNDSILIGDTSQKLVITVLGEYWVIVNNEANGCSTSSDSMNITSLTGVNQLTVESGQLTIYPNPTTGEINILSSKNIDEVTVTNLLGQVVLKSPSGDLGVKQNQFTFELKDEGMYFVTVTSYNETVIKKVLVIK